jgi:hypothetical protein
MLIVVTFGLAFASIVGGVMAIIRSAKSNTEFSLLSVKLSTGVAGWHRPSSCLHHHFVVGVQNAKHRCRSLDAVIRVCDDAGNVIETHEHAGDFKEP